MISGSTRDADPSVAPTITPMRRAVLATFLCAARSSRRPRRPRRDVVERAALRERAAARRRARRGRARSRCRSSAPRGVRGRPPASSPRSRARGARCACSWAPRAHARAGARRRAARARRPTGGVRPDRRARRHACPRAPRWRARWARTRAWPTSSATARSGSRPTPSTPSTHARRLGHQVHVGATTTCGAAAALARRRRRLEAHGRRGRHRRGRDPPRACRPHRAAPTTPHPGASDVTDRVGHGTFVSGLIAAIDGNGIGGKGVAGNTRLLASGPRATGSFTRARDLLRGIEVSVRQRRRRDQHEPGRPGLLRRARRGRSSPPSTTTCCRWPPPATTAPDGNPLEFPAAAIGGRARRARDRPVGHAPRPGGASPPSRTTTTT